MVGTGWTLYHEPFLSLFSLVALVFFILLPSFSPFHLIPIAVEVIVVWTVTQTFFGWLLVIPSASVTFHHVVRPINCFLNRYPTLPQGEGYNTSELLGSTEVYILIFGPIFKLPFTAAFIVSALLHSIAIDHISLSFSVAINPYDLPPSMV